MNTTINVKEFHRHFMSSIQCKEECKEPHLAAIKAMCEALPHGSGIDGIMKFQPENSNGQKLVFFLEFHHMDEHGFYCEWTEHNLILTPSFAGFDLRITGKNYRDIKEYLYQLFDVIFV